jgi:hypothetical protein
MSPIIGARGGLSASAYGLFAASLASATAYESIATVTSTGSAGAMTFTSIPSTYKHLQIRGILRTNDTGTWNNQQMRFNSDTGSNYAFHTLGGDGATASASASASQTSFNDFMRGASNSLSAGIFGVAVVDILDYTNTNKYKVIRALQGGDSNGAGVIGITSGVWMSTSAISTITINPSGGTAIQYSSFALYGIKG